MSTGTPPVDPPFQKDDPNSKNLPKSQKTAVNCPGCRTAVRLPAARVKPGHFRAKCGGCREPFLIEIDENLQVSVRPDPAQQLPDNTSLTPEMASALGLGRPSVPERPKPPKELPRGRMNRVTSPASDSMTRPPTNDHGGDGDASTLPASNGGPTPTTTPTNPTPTTPTAGTTEGATDATPYEPSPSGGPSEARKAGGGAGPTLPPPSQLAGDRLGNYELRKKLGEGGMGAVYLAKQVTLDRDVALKVLSPRLSSAPALIGRFMREAYAAGQLVHHNVVQIYDFGRETVKKEAAGKAQAAAGGHGGNVHYFSMEFVDGGSLQAKLKELPNGRMEPKEAVSLILQAARGLAFAHASGLIHRDVKPDNLMLNRLGVVKVADLGLVKQITHRDLNTAESEAVTAAPAAEANDDAAVQEALRSMTAGGGGGGGSISSAASAEITAGGAMMGTPAYLPPEQATDAKRTDGRADIYALGCTLYHLVVGRPPFGGKTLQEVLDGHRFKPLKFPEPSAGGPELDKELKDLLRRMCAKSPDERQPSMDHVVNDLENYLEETHQAQLEPNQKQQQTLEWAAANFTKSPWAKVRPFVIGGFAALVVLATVACALLVPNPQVGFGAAGGSLGFGVLTLALGFAFVGMRRRDTLFGKMRQYVLGASLIEWAIGLVAAVLLVWVLWNVGWLWWWLGATVLAAGAAALYVALVEKSVESDREPMAARAQQVLRDLRKAGVDENLIKRAVARAGGDHWEGFYEALFGYQDKLDARRTFGVDERGRELPREGAWRDPFLQWLEDRLEARRLRRDQKMMKSLAESELVAKGIRKEVAERQADKMASREVVKAARLREQIKAEVAAELRQALAEERHHLKTIGDDTAADDGADPRDRTGRARAPTQDELDNWFENTPLDERGRPIRRRAVKYTDDEFERERISYFEARYGSLSDILLGQPVRFVLGAILFACFALWFNQNQQWILTGRDIETAQAQAEVADGTVSEAELQARIDRRSGGEAAAAAVDAGPIRTADWFAGRDRSLRIPGVSPTYARWLSGWRVGLAGLMLAVGAFFYGRWLSVMTLACALVSLVAPVVWIETIEAPPTFAWIPLAAAAIVWAGSIFFLREHDE